MNKIYKQSMEVGFYFSKELCDDDTVCNWCGSEECATFTKTIIDYAKKINAIFLLRFMKL